LVRRFEELRAWQEARVLVREVYRLTASGRFAKDFGLRDQMRRAAASTMANTAEGFDCESATETGRFLGIARRSAVEVQSLLYVALDAGYVGEAEFRALYSQADRTKGLIGAFRHSLARRSRPSPSRDT
jgi:four helix bundle protein